MEQNKSDLTELFRRMLVKADMGFHVIAALLLLAACGFIFYDVVLTLEARTRDSIIHLVNDELLALIMLELLWTVIRFLKKQKFILAPFLRIGINHGTYPHGETLRDRPERVCRHNPYGRLLSVCKGSEA